RKLEPRDRLKAALVERPRTVGNPSAAFEETPDRGVRLEALELFKRAQKRVLVIEPDHEPDRHWSIFEAIMERAAVSHRVEGPAQGGAGRMPPPTILCRRSRRSADRPRRATQSVASLSWSASHGSLRRAAFLWLSAPHRADSGRSAAHPCRSPYRRLQPHEPA